MRVVVSLVVSATVILACGGAGTTPRSVTMRGPFTRDGKVEPSGWVIDRGVFSPDGTRVALSGRDDKGRDRVGLAERGKPVSLTPPDMKAYEFAWMPDSKALLVASKSPDAKGVGPRGDVVFYDLAILDLTGAILRKIPLDRQMVTEGMAVRRDGRVGIVAAGLPGSQDTYTDLVEVDLETGATRNLTTTPDNAEENPVYVSDNEVLFSDGKLTLDNDHQPNGWAGVLDLRSGEERRVTPSEHVVGTATASFGGSLVFYEAFRFGDREDQAVWAVPKAGGTPSKVLAGPAYFPSVSPDGRRLLVTGGGSPGALEGLRVVDLPPYTSSSSA